MHLHYPAVHCYHESALSLVVALNSITRPHRTIKYLLTSRTQPKVANVIEANEEKENHSRSQHGQIFCVILVLAQVYITPLPRQPPTTTQPQQPPRTANSTLLFHVNAQRNPVTLLHFLTAHQRITHYHLTQGNPERTSLCQSKTSRPLVSAFSFVKEICNIFHLETTSKASSRMKHQNTRISRAK